MNIRSSGPSGSLGGSGPTFVHSEYVRKTIGNVLVKCLKDVVQTRPADPIEFMAKWLYKHSDNEIYYYQRVLDLKESEMMASV